MAEWLVLMTQRGKELELAEALPAACARHGVAAVTLAPLSGRQPALPGYLLVALSDPGWAGRLKGLADGIHGFIAAPGAPARPALISQRLLDLFLAELKRHELSGPSPPALGARVTVNGLSATVAARDARRRTVVAIRLLGRLIHAAVPRGAALQTVG